MVKLCKNCKLPIPSKKRSHTFCGIRCAVRYRNKHDNPMKKAAARKKVSEASKRQGNVCMMTEESRAKAIPKIAAALKGRVGYALGIPKSEETKEKLSKAMERRFVGSNNPNWKGGLSNRDWKSARYKRFLKEVWNRAGGNCESCGVNCPKNRKSNVHHVKSWEDFPDLRYKPSNGQLLCAKCHRNLHPHEFDKEQIRKIKAHANSRPRDSKGKFLQDSPSL